MNQEDNRLEDIQISSPCPASWGEMRGGDKGRHCETCNLKVHNLAAMSRAEGESLLEHHETGSRLCVRMEFHPDGSCVTSDNPVPKTEKKPRQSNPAAAALALGAGLLAACTGDKSRNVEIDENANLSVDEVPTEHVLQGSLLGEVIAEHTTVELTEGELPAKDPLVMLGGVQFFEDCESPGSVPDVPAVPPQLQGSTRKMLGKVAPRRAIMGSPRAPQEEH